MDTMSDVFFGSPNISAMQQQYPRVSDNFSNMILIPYDQQECEFGPKPPSPTPQILPFEDEYSSANIHNLQLQLYQELRNQVMWQDMRGDASFNSSVPEYESLSDDSSTNTPTFDHSLSSLLDSGHMSSAPSSVDEVANYILPEKEYTTSIHQAPTKPQGKKHKRKHVLPRSKKGCWICRIKHLKCDERRPSCEACRRYGIECDFSGERPAYVIDNELRKQKLQQITRKRRVKGNAQATGLY